MALTLTARPKPAPEAEPFNPRDLERLPALVELRECNEDLNRSEHGARLAIEEVNHLRRSARAARQRLDSTPENVTPGALLALSRDVDDLEAAAREALSAAARQGADCAELQARRDALKVTASAELSGAVTPAWRGLHSEFFERAEGLAETYCRLEALRRACDMLTGPSMARPLPLSRPMRNLFASLLGDDGRGDPLARAKAAARTAGWAE